MTLPVAIRTGAEYRRLLNAAAALRERPEDEISEEESRRLELLSVSEIFSGKRRISKAQARQLAGLLRVPVELFL